MMQLPSFLSCDDHGAIRLAGHRIGLEHLVHFYNEGYSAEMLLGQFPSLSLSLIYKVLAFYLDHTAEVDAYCELCRSTVEEQRLANPCEPSLAELRCRATKPEDWKQFIASTASTASTAGVWQGDLVRPEQGEYEQREELP